MRFIINKKSVLLHTFSGRSSVLQSGFPQLKLQMIQRNIEAFHKLLLHTPIYNVRLSQTGSQVVVSSLLSKGGNSKIENGDLPL